jgi:hypothetical protein
VVEAGGSIAPGRIWKRDFPTLRFGVLLVAIVLEHPGVTELGEHRGSDGAVTPEPASPTQVARASRLM